MSNNEIWKINRFHQPYMILVSNLGNVKQFVNAKEINLRILKDKKGQSYVVLYNEFVGIQKIKLDILINETFNTIPSEWLNDNRKLTIDLLST